LTFQFYRYLDPKLSKTTGDVPTTATPIISPTTEPTETETPDKYLAPKALPRKLPITPLGINIKPIVPKLNFPTTTLPINPLKEFRKMKPADVAAACFGFPITKPGGPARLV